MPDPGAVFPASRYLLLTDTIVRKVSVVRQKQKMYKQIMYLLYWIAFFSNLFEKFVLDSKAVFTFYFQKMLPFCFCSHIQKSTFHSNNQCWPVQSKNTLAEEILRPQVKQEVEKKGNAQIEAVTGATVRNEIISTQRIRMSRENDSSNEVINVK